MRTLITGRSDSADLLHRPAKRVKNAQSTEVILGIQEMKWIATAWEHETGDRCEGLAATQIGWDARVIILRKSDERAPKKPNPNDYFKSDGSQDNDREIQRKYWRDLDAYREWTRCKASIFNPWHVMINPQILSTEGEFHWVEGCLSLPGTGYKVKRPSMIVFKYRKPNNRMSPVLVAQGEDAGKLQHEVDHIYGRLIRDHAIEAYLGDDRQPL